MKILLLRHYPLVEGPSMRSYADQIASSLRSRGHQVFQITAPVVFGKLLPKGHPIAKWLGYLDQFVLFPPLLAFRAHSLPRGSLCVLTDQALGPWFPWLSGRPHLIHCHDLLAFQAALGLQPFCQLNRSGRIYQWWIHRGFRRGRCFLSVSKATQAALEPCLAQSPLLSEVLYNACSARFLVIPKEQAIQILAAKLPEIGNKPFLFHIGRNWYKNRLGVLAIWEQMHLLGAPIHLVLVGSLDAPMQAWMSQRKHLAPWLHMLQNASDRLVVALYNSASALVFPSHAEGFGWPILEALACSCPVVTTNVAPMNEVGGPAADYIPPAPSSPELMESWALQAAQHVVMVLARTPKEQERVRQLGLGQVKYFQLSTWEDLLESHYQRALALQEAT
jgi:glycosyltransferase involved in cell wall biosynthesis